MFNKRMFNKIALAVSAALISSSVYAVSPTIGGVENTPDIEIFMSGASAQDKAIASLFSSICITNTLDVFKNDGAKPGKAHTTYFCEIDSAQIVGGTTTTNPTVMLHKRSKGGSAQGVNPLIDEVAIDAMEVFNNVTNASNCTETAAGSKDWRCTINNPGDIIQVVSDAGVSDVNPKMFVGVNAPAGNSPVNSADVDTKLVVTPAAALVFGVPVTTGLRKCFCRKRRVLWLGMS